MASDVNETEPDEGLTVQDLVAWLRECTSYDPETGAFVWSVCRRYAKAGIGEPVGGKDRLGYWRVRINGRIHSCHRLIWLREHGRWPVGLIDHANGNPSDNRLANLREASRSQNAANKKRHVNGKSGFKGVSFHRATGLWQAQIMLDGKKRYLGVFDSPERAHSAYKLAASQFFSEYARAA